MENVQAITSSQAAASPQKYAWGALLFFSVVLILFGIGDVINGQNADPAIIESITGQAWAEIQAENPVLAEYSHFATRSGGVHLIVMGFLLTMVILNGFRRAERWAWYTMWALPLWSAVVFFTFFLAERSPDFDAPPPMLSGPVFFVLSALALLLSYRRFFPKK